MNMLQTERTVKQVAWSNKQDEVDQYP